MPNETYGVCQRVQSAILGRSPASGRVERREECIVDEHTCTGQSVEQAGLARIGIADDGDRRHLMTAAIGPLGLACGVHLTKRRSQLRDAAVDAAPISLQFGLARPTTADADTARWRDRRPA